MEEKFLSLFLGENNIRTTFLSNLYSQKALPNIESKILPSDKLINYPRKYLNIY